MEQLFIYVQIWIYLVVGVTVPFAHIAYRKQHVNSTIPELMIRLLIYSVTANSILVNLSTIIRDAGFVLPALFRFSASIQV